MFKRDFVPPSGLLDPVKADKISAFNKNYSNTPIRIGTITKVHEINDETNMSKLFPEYDVVTSEQNQEMGQGFVEYNNCTSLDSLGGLADFFEFKKRKYDKENFRDTYQFDKQDGSMVLILCADGFSDKAIIMGGIGHPGRDTTLNKEAGLHLEGEYNGLNWQVNKDGEMTITFKSKTNNKGEPQDKTSGGTTVKMDKKGSIDLNTNLKGAEETYMRMDKENKNVGLKAGANVGFTAKKDIAMNADGKITGKAKGAIELAAEGTAKFTAKSTVDIEGKSAVNVKGGNVIINGQNGVIIQGQQCMIDTPKVFVGQGGTPAVIVTTKFVGSGNHGAPVTCTAVGPFSSSVFIAS